MKKLLLTAFTSFACVLGAQTIYTQDFEGTHGWTLNVSTGSEGADPNFFVVNANEGGVAAGGCSVNNNGNKTLHVTSVFNPSGGASYDAGGLCGFLFCPQTNRRAESPTINCTGYNNLKLSFDFIANGDALNDNASVHYFNGSTWSTLVASLKSTLCGGGQGSWATYTVTLPASANNNANVKIGFGWVNNDDGVGTDPSLAVNDVVISTLAIPLTASLTTTPVLCFGTNTGSASISASGGQTPYTYDWAPGTPTGDGTPSVTGLSANAYTCTVQDALGITTTHTFAISQPPAITAVRSLTICAGQSVIVGANTYTATGTYTNVLTSLLNGCDSTLTTNLTVSPAINAGTSLNGMVISASTSAAGYQWINCGNGNQTIPGATGQSYTATASGNYAVIVSVGSCSVTSSCVSISSVGMKEQNDLSEVRLYPNPVNSILQLSGLAKTAIIEVYNTIGELQIQFTSQGDDAALNLSGLSNGIYFVKIRSQVAEFTGKVVIQH